ncbi:MAG TPA: HAD-IA family hydrolase [Mycobacterium sp.]|nr:HAD-IA family hydrolase [Mycobacterium sp.]
MPITQEKTWRAGRFWWDRARTTEAEMYPLRAVIFDLDALTDIECDGHRLAFNAAFAAHGLDIEWSVTRYRQLLALSDERQRVSAELRKRGIATECDVLTELLADDITATKTMLYDELILEADLSPRPGLHDLVMDAYAAGVLVGVVTNGQRSWAEPLVRQLVGEGIVESLVTGDDVQKPLPDREAYQLALSELGISEENALAVTGSASGLRAAKTMGLATVVITGGGTPDFPGAVAVRADYAGTNPLRIADCQRLQSKWWKTHKPSAA